MTCLLKSWEQYCKYKSVCVNKCIFCNYLLINCLGTCVYQTNTPTFYPYWLSLNRHDFGKILENSWTSLTGSVGYEQTQQVSWGCTEQQRSLLQLQTHRTLLTGTLGQERHHDTCSARRGMYTQISFSPEIGTLQNKTTSAPGDPCLIPSFAVWECSLPPMPTSACCSEAAAGAAVLLAEILCIYCSQGIPQRNSPYIPPAARSLLMSSRTQLIA